ncbi:hypothetical protein LINPERHAP2_LOCUS33003 [Linum perenne]
MVRAVLYLPLTPPTGPPSSIDLFFFHYFLLLVLSLPPRWPLGSSGMSHTPATISLWAVIQVSLGPDATLGVYLLLVVSWSLPDARQKIWCWGKICACGIEESGSILIKPAVLAGAGVLFGRSMFEVSSGDG